MERDYFNINQMIDLIIQGYEKGLVHLYDDELIQKLRTIYDGELPASITLLSNFRSNGYCQDRSTLLARAFLDTSDDIKILCITIKSLRLNPKVIAENDPTFQQHYVVERTDSNGKKFIYDTSAGFIYDKDFYWDLEDPEIVSEEEKKEIAERVKREQLEFPEDIETNKEGAFIMLPIIELSFSDPTEKYAVSGLLQREVQDFKKRIGYSAMSESIEKDMQARMPWMSSKR